MKITPEMLRQRGTCADQLAVFEARWPDGVEVTLEACQEAVRLGLNVFWAAEKFLPRAAYDAYEQDTARAWDAYDQAIDTAEDAYEKAVAPARNAYLHAAATAFFHASQMDDGGNDE